MGLQFIQQDYHFLQIQPSISYHFLLIPSCELRISPKSLMRLPRSSLIFVNKFGISLAGISKPFWPSSSLLSGSLA